MTSSTYPLIARPASAAKSYLLRLNPAYYRPVVRVGMSEEAVKSVSGTIYDVGWGGVQLEQSVQPLPFIYLRTAPCNKIFVTRHELAEMAEEFGITAIKGYRPREILEGAFFVNTSARSIGTRELEIAPRWSELVDPKWRKAFLNWVEGKAGLPKPRVIPFWKTLPRGVLPFPMMVNMPEYRPENKREWEGRMELKAEAGGCYAWFYTKKGKVDIYRLSRDSKTDTDQIEYGGKPFSEDETFNRERFRNLFGEDKSKDKYEFTRKASRTGLYLTAIHCETLIATGVSLKAGTLYKVRAERYPNKIKFLLRSQNDKAEALRGELVLERGYPLSREFSVTPRK
jgi:hypothetical protein